MTIYFISLAFILFLAPFVHKNSSQKSANTYVIISFAAIILISALRKYTIGTDLRLYYYNSYLVYQNWDFADYINNSYETGYYCLNVLIGKLNADPQWFIAITSVIIFGVYAWFIMKNSENVVMSIFLFITMNYWFMSLNILRQAIAIGICLIGIQVLNNKKLGKKRIIWFILLIFIASTFHNSAVIMLLIIPIHYFKFKKTTIVIIVFFEVMAMLLYEALFKLAASIIDHRDYVRFYLDNAVGDSGGLVAMNIAIYTLIFIFSLIILVYVNPQKESDESSDSKKGIYSDDFLLYMMALFLLTRILATHITIFGRASYYFYPYLLILMPRIESRITNKTTRIIYKFVLYFGNIILFVVTSALFAQALYGVTPYYFFWQ